MNNKRAKEITLEVWRFRCNNPDKTDLPIYLRDKIKDFLNTCPLCELFEDQTDGCPGCPLGEAKECYETKQSAYYRWSHADTDDERRVSAGRIVEVVEQWSFFCFRSLVNSKCRAYIKKIRERGGLGEYTGLNFLP
jgi:hypothetical protein